MFDGCELPCETAQNGARTAKHPKSPKASKYQELIPRVSTVTDCGGFKVAVSDHRTNEEKSVDAQVHGEVEAALSSAGNTIVLMASSLSRPLTTSMSCQVCLRSAAGSARPAFVSSSSTPYFLSAHQPTCLDRSNCIEPNPSPSSRCSQNHHDNFAL